MLSLLKAEITGHSTVLKEQVHGSANAHQLNYYFPIYYQFYRLIIPFTCISAMSESTLQ